jgi:hypothetical protein
MVNLVHFYGLETGQELRVPFDPLAVQQKKVLLDAVRVCGTFRRLVIPPPTTNCTCNATKDNLTCFVFRTWPLEIHKNGFG